MYTLTPLVTGALDAARPFVSEHIRGMCGIQGSSLLIFEVAGGEGRLVSEVVPLSYTPRAMARLPGGRVWYVVQCEGNTLGGETREGLRANANVDKDKELIKGGGEGEDVEMGGGDGKAEDMEKHLGLPRGMHHWASCISAVDPVYNKAVTSHIELEDNEAALCCAVVQFQSRASGNAISLLARGGICSRARSRRGRVRGSCIFIACWMRGGGWSCIIRYISPPP